jgi:hypothetical protein
MKAKKNWILTIVLLVIFLTVAQVTKIAGKSEQKTTTTPKMKFVSQRDALTGLQGVYVLVEDFKPDDEKYGLNSEMFKTDVELRLRQYGVKVLSDAEMVLAANHPRLYINLLPNINEKVGIVSVKVSVELNEYVVLMRNTSTVANAITWKSRTLSIYRLNRLDMEMKAMEGVRDLVDRFIKSYLAANPKEQLPQQKTKK